MKRWCFTIFTLIFVTGMVINVCKAKEYDSTRFDLLTAHILDKTFKDINSIIIARHGKILFEEYFNGATPPIHCTT